ncbi:MAG: hypothetical protein UT31_C0026G0004 [Parcubacteria group bacterium GW2011_GWF2_39_13b]|nr:MAG: hypothetical protein UT31_C0026G0004 [Parcubacteria group bacterium GW2011_GWF2_39_13b]
MTQKEIKAKHEEYAGKIQELKEEIEKVQLAWRQLQAKCKHPKAYRTTCCGEEGHYCPDCGWS